MAAREETLGKGGHGYLRQWSGTGLAVTGSSYMAPWHSWLTPWNGSLLYGGVATRKTREKDFCVCHIFPDFANLVKNKPATFFLGNS